MAHRYGPLTGLRKAALRLCCGLFIMLLALTSASAAKPRILVLGDSLAAGYGLAQPDGFQAKLQAAFPGITLIDAAVSGDTTAGGLARLDWSLADGADAAIVELGGNDGLRGIDPRNTAANLTAILDALQARKIPVLLSGMYAPPNLGDAYQADFRAVFDRLGARPGVIYDPFFLEGVAGDPALNQADGIHPDPEGVKRVIARIRPKVVELLSKVKAR
jgi:acyl-CoA thioesterase-1